MVIQTPDLWTTEMTDKGNIFNILKVALIFLQPQIKVWFKECVPDTSCVFRKLLLIFITKMWMKNFWGQMEPLEKKEIIKSTVTPDSVHCKVLTCLLNYVWLFYHKFLLFGDQTLYDVGMDFTYFFLYMVPFLWDEAEKFVFWMLDALP